MRLAELQVKHNTRRSKSGGGLSGDRQRVFKALEERGNGSIMRGWRRELDPEGALEIGFQEFCKSMAQLGVQVDVGRLFSLDGEPSRVTLEDFAPLQSALINRFRDWVKATFEGPIGMFEVFTSGSGGGQINRESFIAGCKERRFKTTEQELEELFQCLDYDETDSVTKDEIMFLECNQEIRDSELFRLKMKSRSQRQRALAYVYQENGLQHSAKNRHAQRPWMAETFEKLPAIVCEKRITQQQVFYKNCILARQAFVEHIRGRYGNEVRAWRRGLDSDCFFRVAKSTLRQYCRHHDLDIDFSYLWRALDRDCDGYFTIEEIGVRPAQVLASFRLWARESFGSCSAIWDLPEVDAERGPGKPQMNGRWVSDKKMPVGPFGRCLKKLGWEDSEALVVLMQALDLYGCGFVSLPDLWWLDAWDPPEWLSHAPDLAALVEFQALVNAEYDAPLKAWRMLLDADSDNMVSWAEFSSACRKVKFRGNAGGAWRCLDRDCAGIISLKEWDPKGAELLVSFKNWAEASFGSVELAFKAFDKNGSGNLSLAELKRACRRLKWAGDVRLLFSCLGLVANKDKGAGRACLVPSDVVFLDSWIEQDLLLENLFSRTSPKKGTGKDKEQSVQDGIEQGHHDSMAAYKHSPQMNQSLSMLHLEQPHQRGIPEDSSASEQPEKTPRTEHDRLHKMYHVMKSSEGNRVRPRKQPGQKSFIVPPRSKSLPWLEKLLKVDASSTL